MLRHALAAVALGAGLTAHARDPLETFDARTYKGGGKTLPYRLMVPKAYKPGVACPLIVWLHGSGEKGTDNAAQVKGLAGTFLADPDRCPAFVMAPQCPPNVAWHAVGLNKPPEVTDPARMTAAAVAGLLKEFGLDGRRVYVGGFSMGGCGVWEFLTRYPGLFAAAFPIAGPPHAGAPGERPGLAAVVKHVPVWVFHGDKDRLAPVDGSRAVVAALKAAGGDVRYTEYPGGSHEFTTAVKEPKLTAWLFAQKRAADPDFTLAKVPEDAALVTRTLPDGRRGTWTGAVERTRQGAPRLAIENVRYRLKPAANAGPGVADLLAKIGRGERTGEFAVTGTVELADLAWLAVETIEARN